MSDDENGPLAAQWVEFVKGVRLEERLSPSTVETMNAVFYAGAVAVLDIISQGGPDDLKALREELQAYAYQKLLMQHRAAGRA